jgi:hypothetical protein
MMPHGISPRGAQFQKVYTTATRMVKRLKRGAARAGNKGGGMEKAPPPGLVTGVLITGRGGVGKSALAALLGKSLLFYYELNDM